MKVIIFSVADKTYGADISRIREVIRMRKVTKVPDAADFIEGVISLRGKVIPLINLRKKLGFGVQLIPSIRIIIVKLQESWLGVLVDRVEDVITLKDEEITKPDEILKSARYLTGVAKHEGNLVLLVELAEFLMGDEKASLQKVRERVEVRKKETE